MVSVAKSETESRFATIYYYYYYYYYYTAKCNTHNTLKCNTHNTLFMQQKQYVTNTWAN